MPDQEVLGLTMECMHAQAVALLPDLTQCAELGSLMQPVASRAKCFNELVTSRDVPSWTRFLHFHDIMMSNRPKIANRTRHLVRQHMLQQMHGSNLLSFQAKCTHIMLRQWPTG